jgi:hypothetical protein
MMTAPLPRARIDSTTARVHRNGPVTLTSKCRSHVSSVVLRSGALSAMPALLTSTSTPPIRSNVLTTAGSSVTSQISVRTSPPISASACASRPSATT